MSFDGFTLDRRQFLLGVLGGAGALAVGACSSSRSQADGRTLRLAHGALGFPSPFSSNADIGYNQMILLYDTLLWKDGSGELLPWLAKSYRLSDDRLTYTFELRDDVKWSDGRPLTVDDVVFTFDYYERQETLGPPIIIQPPQGIAKVSGQRSTVEVTLEAPRVTFAEEVAGALPIIPKHVWQAIDDPASALDPKVHLVGSGPYRLESYNDDGNPLLYTAREDYFLGPPYVKRIQMKALEDQFAALLAGEIDVARGFGLRDDIIRRFEGNDAYGTISAQGTWIGGALYWNIGKEGALSDPRFRHACAMAVDRPDLVTRLAAGRGLPGNPGFLSQKNPYYTQVRPYGFDVAGANALLDSAGYGSSGDGVRRDRDGNPLSFPIRFDVADAALGELLVPSFRRIGVEVRPDPVQIGPELFGKKYVGAYDLIVLPYPGPSPGGPNSDPDVLRRLFSSDSPPSLTSATAYANRRVDELAAKQLVTFEEQERRGAVAEMQRLIADDIPILPLWYPDRTLIFRKGVLDQWYFTPGQFPASEDNKQLFITGRKAGTEIRPTD